MSRCRIWASNTISRCLRPPGRRLSRSGDNASVGDPITGPRNTFQNTFDLSGSLSWVHGRHEFKFGGGYRVRVLDDLLEGAHIEPLRGGARPGIWIAYDVGAIAGESRYLRPLPLQRNVVGVEYGERRAAHGCENPVQLQFGNEGRNAVLGPRYVTWDVSVFKNIRLAESKELQFRGELFNVLNHTNFRLPVSDIESQTFGQIQSDVSPRVIQVALKFLF